MNPITRVLRPVVTVTLYLLVQGCAPAIDDRGEDVISTDPILLNDSQRARQLPPFSDLWACYQENSLGSVQDVKDRLGGEVNDDWITNTCAIRMSAALNCAGFEIPRDVPGLHTINGQYGPSGPAYAYRVSELSNYLWAAVGSPNLISAEENDFAGKRGIIKFQLSGSTEYTGHFDLWDGAEAAYSADWGEETQLWMPVEQLQPQYPDPSTDGSWPTSDDWY